MLQDVTIMDFLSRLCCASPSWCYLRAIFISRVSYVGIGINCVDILSFYLFYLGTYLALNVLSCCTFAAESVAFIPNPKLPALLVVIFLSLIFSAQNTFTSLHLFDPSALACHSSYACSNMPVFISTETVISTASTSEIAAFVRAANNCPSSTYSWRDCHPSWRFQSAFI